MEPGLRRDRSAVFRRHQGGSGGSEGRQQLDEPMDEPMDALSSEEELEAASDLSPRQVRAPLQ